MEKSVKKSVEKLAKNQWKIGEKSVQTSLKIQWKKLVENWWKISEKIGGKIGEIFG